MSGTESRELVNAVRQFLKDEILPELEGFKAYQVRVAANALGIVDRELSRGDELAALDVAAAATLGLEAGDGSIAKRLAAGLRDGSVIADQALLAYLRRRVQLSLAIDNPRYSGLQQSLERWGDLSGDDNPGKI